MGVRLFAVCCDDEGGVLACEMQGFFFSLRREICGNSLDDGELATEIENVLLDGMCHLIMAGVDVCHCGGPCLWVREGQVDRVTLSDVTRDHQSCQNWNRVPSILKIWNWVRMWF